MYYQPIDQKSFLGFIRKKELIIGLAILIMAVVLILARYAVQKRILTEKKAQAIPTPTPTPEGPISTPTPTPGPWFKLRNADFHRPASVVNIIPDSINYDPIGDITEDPPNPCNDNPQASPVEEIRCFDLNLAGIVSSSQTIDTGTAPISKRGWRVENYNAKKTFTPGVFLEYIKARKRYVTISSDQIIDPAVIQKGRINLLVGSYIIDLPAVTSTFSSVSPFVLVVDGDLTINQSINLYDTTAFFSIVVTGKLNIKSVVTEMRGIYIADSVDFAYDIDPLGISTQERLKLVGNLIVTTPTDTIGKRQPADPADVPIFVIVDAKQEAAMLPYLSIKNYQWEEVIP